MEIVVPSVGLGFFSALLLHLSSSLSVGRMPINFSITTTFCMETSWSTNNCNFLTDPEPQSMNGNCLGSMIKCASEKGDRGEKTHCHLTLVPPALWPPWSLSGLAAATLKPTDSWPPRSLSGLTDTTHAHSQTNTCHTEHMHVHRPTMTNHPL